MTYTKEEVRILYNMLRDIKVCDYHLAGSLNEANYDIEKAFRDVDDAFIDGDRVVILSVWPSRTITFLTEIPLEDVPLKVFDPILGVYATWRLKIGK